MDLAGTYREIKAPERLVFTWQWQTAPNNEMGETVVTVDFIEQGDATEIRLTDEGLPEGDPRDHHAQGWNGCFDCLGEHRG